MDINEIIENLEYCLSDECTYDIGDIQEEIAVAIEALKRSKPTKPDVEEHNMNYFDGWKTTKQTDKVYYCPACHKVVLYGWDAVTEVVAHCGCCGQKLDWSEKIAEDEKNIKNQSWRITCDN